MSVTLQTDFFYGEYERRMQQERLANVAKHFSLHDLADRQMQQFPRPTAPGYRSNTDEAMRVLGGVQHSAAQIKAYQQQLESLFVDIKKADKPLQNVFNEIEQAMVKHASGNRPSATIQAYIQKRDGEELSRLQSYWQRM